MPEYKGKKLEMKIVGNKFELLKTDEDSNSDIVTEVSVIKLPSTNSRTNVINTGLVEERTNQYLKRISQPYTNTKKEFDLMFRDSSIVTSKLKDAREFLFINLLFL